MTSRRKKIIVLIVAVVVFLGFFIIGKSGLFHGEAEVVTGGSLTEDETEIAKKLQNIIALHNVNSPSEIPEVNELGMGEGSLFGASIKFFYSRISYSLDEIKKHLSPLADKAKLGRNNMVAIETDLPEIGAVYIFRQDAFGMNRIAPMGTDPFVKVSQIKNTETSSTWIMPLWDLYGSQRFISVVCKQAIVMDAIEDEVKKWVNGGGFVFPPSSCRLSSINIEVSEQK